MLETQARFFSGCIARSHLQCLFTPPMAGAQRLPALPYLHPARGPGNGHVRTSPRRIIRRADKRSASAVIAAPLLPSRAVFQWLHCAPTCDAFSRHRWWVRCAYHPTFLCSARCLSTQLRRRESRDRDNSVPRQLDPAPRPNTRDRLGEGDELRSPAARHHKRPLIPGPRYCVNRVKIRMRPLCYLAHEPSTTARETRAWNYSIT